ncbi:MAG: hypothetical protein KC910_21275 [Candidatus Eremiobacteraeota bacterium]|nr:hypothetical protein [Candidatus Eremiobacteraeota bacterium]
MRSRRRAAMLIVALALIGVLWFLVIGFASHSSQAVRLARAGLASERALWAAEAGIRQTLDGLGKDVSYRPKSGYVRMAHTTESYKVQVFTPLNSPIKLSQSSLYVLATGRDRSGLERRVAVVVTLSQGSSPVSFSVFANHLDMSGGCYMDSFNSTVGPSPKGSEATVATNSIKPASIELSGGSYIQGRIQVGPGGVTGEARPSRPTKNTDNVVWKDWSCWSLEESSLDKPIELPAVESPTPGKEDIKVNYKGADIAPGSYAELQASGGGEVRLKGGVYVFKSLKLTGGAKLSFTGSSEPAVVYITDSLDMSNGVFYNTSLRPKNLVFMMAKGSEAKITGGAQAYAIVYGPEANLDLKGGTDLYGALVGNEVVLRGGAHVHYDVDLAKNPPPVFGQTSSGGLSVQSWQRL